jgi:hypothetical protein
LIDFCWVFAGFFSPPQIELSTEQKGEAPYACIHPLKGCFRRIYQLLYVASAQSTHGCLDDNGDGMIRSADDVSCVTHTPMCLTTMRCRHKAFMQSLSRAQQSCQPLLLLMPHAICLGILHGQSSHCNPPSLSPGTCLCLCALQCATAPPC